jgi:hypothetical protein
MNPQFQHDCDRCKFLGHFFGHDVYVCLSDESTRGGAYYGTTIARFSSEPSEYHSSPLHMMEGDFIRENEEQLESFMILDWYKAIIVGLASHTVDTLKKEATP